MILELSLLAFICFALRFWPRWLARTATSSDTHFHLFFSKAIRNNSGTIPKNFQEVVIPHRADYPFFYHWILSRFSTKNAEIIERITSPLSDTLIMLLIPTIARQCGFQHEPKMVLLICLIYTIYPGLFRGSSGPRAFSGCPRVMGQFLYLAHLTLYVHFIQTNQYWAIITSVLIGATLPVTAKFGTQVLLFFLPIVAYASPSYLPTFLGSFILSFIIWRQNLINVVKGQFLHSVFYYRYIQRNFVWPHRVPLSAYLRDSFYTFKLSLRNFSLKPFMNYVFGVRHPINTLVFIFPLHTYFLIRILSSSDFSNIWVACIVTSFVWFILTCFKYLSFIGESERYLEYSLVPCLIFVTPQISEIITYFIPIMAFISCSLSWEYFKNNKQRSIDLIKLRNDLSVLNNNDVIWPIGSFHHTSLCFGNSKVISFGANLDEKVIGFPTYQLIYKNAPYPSENWKQIFDVYNPNWVLTDQAHWNHYIKNVLNNDVEEFKASFEITHQYVSGILLLKRIKNCI